MDVHELEKLTTALHGDLETKQLKGKIIISPPDMIVRYDGDSEYTPPPEARKHFKENPDSVGFKADDGYVYWCQEQLIRQKDLSDDVKKVFNSDPIQKYLTELLSDDGTLFPDWNVHLTEVGSPSMDRINNIIRNPFITITYDIPGEEVYKLAIGVLREDSKIKFHAYITTSPDILSFDGHAGYTHAILLDLFDGILKNKEALKSSPVPLPK